MNPLQDIFNRPLKDLRISVTDRCNFRCSYCMPFKEYEWIPKDEVLSFEEVVRLAKIFVRLGVEKVRLTGGEPLLRKELEKLIVSLSLIQGLKDICLTTNGFLLADQAALLQAAGLKRINVSLDSLDPDKFKRITQGGELSQVLKGLFEAKKAGLGPIKVNSVIIRDVNDDEILGLARFCRENNFIPRFIEYMDVGNANGWNPNQVVSLEEITQKIYSYFPFIEIENGRGTDAAVEYQYLDGKGSFGVIASVTRPFCSSCVRGRLTADGRFVTCLFSTDGSDLKQMVRSGVSDDQIENRIQDLWSKRKDQYSRDRGQALNSNKGYDAKTVQKIEMITLGG